LYLNEKNNMKMKQEKFLELFEPLKQNLWRFCLSVTYNYEDAKDLVQDTIETAYRNFDSIKDAQYFLSWLFTVASRKNKEKYEKRKNEIILYDIDYSHLSSNEGNPEIQADIKLLYEALDKLPYDQKEAIILNDIIGLSQKDAAESQNINIDAYKQRIHRGKKTLKELLLDKNLIPGIVTNNTMEAL
jgi:RNA polymerase sigma-70 factor (ECF subfamily)